MIKIPINENDLTWAKDIRVEFDKNKGYDKIKCSNNYIGLLGELKFHQWLDEFKIPHEWIPVIKDSFDEPDFIINGKTIDLKTTHDFQLWFQKAIFDYYILARINKDSEKELILIGYISGKRLNSLIDKNKITIVQREGRTDFVCDISYLKPIENLFIEIFGNEDKYTSEIRKKEIENYKEEIE